MTNREKYSELSISQIFSNADDCILVLKMQGENNPPIIFDANESLCKVHGYSKDELLGKPITILDDNAPANIMKERIEAVLKNGHAVFEVSHKRKDGSVLHAEASVTLFSNKNEQYFVSIERDITKRLETEKNLISEKERAIHSDQMKSNFLSMMSHEIRTPLNAILGFTGLTLDMELPGEARDHLEIIQSSGKSLLRLINDILDFSKIEKDQLKIRFEPIELEPFFKKLFSKAKIALTEKKSDIEMSVNLSENLPPAITGDAIRIEQILYNIIDNAIKYTDKGSIKIEVSRIALDKLGHSVIQIIVQDTGIGITQNDSNTIFKPFYQEGNVFSRKESGIGLGLAIAKKLVELMSGSIRFESRVGENHGTTFFIEIPCQKSNITYSKKNTKTVTKAETNTEAKIVPINFTGKSILIVDDDSVSLSLMEKICQKAGFQVYLKNNGKDALEFVYSEQGIDIILLDIQMQDISGLDVCKKIRSFEKDNNLERQAVLIALSAAALDSDYYNGIAAGFNEYLTKPVNQKDLFNVFTKYLGQN